MKEYLEILRMAPWQKFYIQIKFVTFYTKKEPKLTLKKEQYSISLNLMDQQYGKSLERLP